MLLENQNKRDELWAGDVLSQSLEKAAQAGLSVAVTHPWYDIDTITDLYRLQEELNHLKNEQLIYTRAFFAKTNF